jgi:hypothetical protein
MKRFEYEKVKKVAIDSPDHQQIYVLDHDHRDEVINELIKMGFITDSESISNRYAYLPFVINTLRKRFFTVGSVGIMACAVQQGAKVLNIIEMRELFYRNASDEK